MQEYWRRLADGVELSVNQTGKFKTGLLGVTLTIPLSAGTATAGALIPEVLSRGSRNHPSMEQLSAATDALYGASLGPVVRQRGESQCVSFLCSLIDDRYALDGSAVLEPAAPSSAVTSDRGQPEPAEVGERYTRRIMPVSIPLFALGFKGTPAPAGEGLRQRLVGELVCDVLFSTSAPLYNRLYEQGLLNSSLGSYYSAVPGCAWIMAEGESRDPERVRDEVLKEAARLAAEGIDPALWDRLKNAAYGAMVRHLNSMEDTCMELAEAHFKGEDYLSFPQVFQSIERADGEALLRTWCTEERMSLSVIAPEE